MGSVCTTLSGDEESDKVFTSASRRGVLDAEDVHILSSIYRKLNTNINGSTSDVDVTVNSAFLRYTSIVHRGKAYSSSRSSRTGTQYVTFAQWDENLLGQPPTPLPDAIHPDSKFRSVKVRHYIRVSVLGSDNNVSYLSLAVIL